jgi:hypothetical protein
MIYLALLCIAVFFAIGTFNREFFIFLYSQFGLGPYFPTEKRNIILTIRVFLFLIILVCLT